MTQPPHDEPTAKNTEELREQVEQTREELGQTVEALAAKTDVKARAQEKAAEVKGQIAAREVRVKAAEAGQWWQDKAPESVRAKTSRAATAARDNRLWLAAAGAAVAVWLVCRRRNG
jgi:hypothetical protein